MSSTPPITLSGFSSGIPTDQIITQLMAIARRPINNYNAQIQRIQGQDSIYSALKSLASKIKTDLTNLTANTLSSPDLFNRKTATSSDTGVAVVSATNDAAAPQTISLTINAAATATSALSQAASFGVGVGKPAVAATLAQDIFPKSITTGTMTIYKNGTPYVINIDKTQDLTAFATSVAAIAGGTISSSIDANGKITLTDSGGATLSVGASSDTSNFADITGLKFAAPGSPIAGRNLTFIDLNADVTTAAANLNTVVTGGSTFTIGTTTFSVGNKSLNTLINEINNDTGAGVTATYNSTTNKLQLISKTTGSQYIAMSDTAGNFLTSLGLVVGGNPTTSQTRGTDASITLNGNTIQSSSNTVTSDISGIAGLTLNLVGGAASTATITIGRDNTPVIDNIKSFVNDFNSLISSIDTNINAVNGALGGDTALQFFRNKLRQAVTDRNTTATTYQNLGSVGISTGAVTGTSTVNTSLILDETLLTTALNTDPDDVKELMIGATNGVMTRLKTIVDAALVDESDDNQDGIFASRTFANFKRIEQINRTIERTEERLAKKEELLRRQFAAMETAISTSKSQGAAISNLSAQFSANNS